LSNATSSGDELYLSGHTYAIIQTGNHQRMMDDFEYLLHTIVQNPELKIKDIRQADFHELEDNLAKWNNTFADYPKDVVLHDIVAQHAVEDPDKVILRFGDESNHL